MLRKEDYMTIKGMAAAGCYQKDIADALGVHPKTVSRALKRGSAPARRRRKRGSKLEPFLWKVDELLGQGVWNAMVILREIQALGYAGQQTMVRDYVRPKRILRTKRATVRFETEPGRQLQCDWGTQRTVVAGEEVDVQFIVNTLGYSRRTHFWCTDSQDAEHTLEGLVRTFEYLGGIPKEVLLDNLKAAVLRHPSGQPAVFQERFLDFAGHYGFVPKACQPYRARTKGKDERAVGYIKHHFFVRYREFESWVHLNQLAEEWLRTEADPRVHGTTHEVVAERFARELPALQPLPLVRFNTSYREWRQVSWDGYIEVRGNRYSVPAEYVGSRVEVRIGLDERVQVWHGERFVTEHRLRAKTEGWVTLSAHHADLWRTLMPVEQRPLSVYAQEVEP
ncbi:IS21 family transposase [Accumulibacter sp.]|uniref:IS21 family transposase n=1 Tax=Accumulibacter sp. TaxID=2053492 RepID=UPI0035B104C9